MKHLVTLLLALSLLLGACALADDRADMLVAAAVNELGYSATKGGYSKYGEWGGSAYGEWCSEFVSWCVNFADEYYGASMLGNDYPLQTSCEGGAMWYKERGRYVTVNGGLRGEEGQFYLSDGVSVSDRPYIPKKGDLIYIEWYKYNRLDHVGIVEMVTQDSDGTYYVHTIEGNNHILGPTPSVVRRYTYRLDDDSIRGYGVLAEGLVGWELGMGASGSQVIALQKNLKELGYYNGEVDGQYGPGTAEAVRVFQAQHGLDSDGIAGEATRTRLYAQDAQTCVPTATPTATPSLLKKGDASDAVREMQQRLKELGYYDGEVDGDFGGGTEEAVRLYQRQNVLRRCAPR